MSMKCNFCGKSQDMVKRLIAGPGVYICDECVELCQEIVEEGLDEQGEPKPEPPVPVYVILEDDKVKSAVFEPELALRHGFGGSGEKSILIFDGNTGNLLETLGKTNEENIQENVEENKGEWIKTDDLQWVIQLDEDMYRVLNAMKFVGDVYTLTDKLVVVSSYPNSELENIAQGGYESLEHLKAESGDNWKQIIAEMISEQFSEPTMTFESLKDFVLHLEMEYGIDCNELS